MLFRHGSLAASAAGLILALAVRLPAQGQPQTPPPPSPPVAPPAAGAQGEHGGQDVPRRDEPPRFPAQQRAKADPAVTARGKGLYSGACSACHGADARGGQLGGVNLLRSQLVLNDKEGELIAPVVQNGRPGTLMVPIPMSLEDIKAVAAFLHDLQSQGSNQGGPPPGEPTQLDILIGDARAGAAFFTEKCSKCHAADGDMKGIATRFPEAKTLQNAWVSGGRARSRGQRPAGAAGNAPQVTATVTLASGEKIAGQLLRIDDFLVSIAQPDGTVRSIRREGDTPAVEVRDPLAAHNELLAAYTDKNMHDVTAYLATLK